MAEITRREALHLLAAASGSAAFRWSDDDVTRARDAADGAQQRQFVPKFFTRHELATVRVLADLIIPRDARSGSATDAGVPQFMDFMLHEADERTRVAMRGGLAWLDDECQRRSNHTFVAASAAQRTALLDAIAFPRRAAAGMRHGVAFFNSFRDLTASGFWSSRMGVKDLQYQGNVAIAEWKGCPDAALRKLGVSYSGEEGPR